ncbi:MAG: hypothetical protein ABW032_08945 [Burkholderiaceae bacterium]
MWWAGSRSAARSHRTAEVFLAAKAVALEGGDGSSWTASAANVDEALASLARRLSSDEGGSRPSRLRVWLGGSLCRPVRLEAIGARLSVSERRRVDDATAVARSGLTPPCRVGLENPSDPGGRLAVVVEERVLAAVDGIETALDLKVTLLRPWWSELLRLALVERPDLQALAVWECGALTLLASAAPGAGTGFSTARCAFPIGDAASAHAAFLRLSLSEGIDPRQALAVGLALDGPPVAARQSGFDLSGLPFGERVFGLEDSV